MNFIRCPLLTSDGWRRKKRWLLLEIHSLPLAAVFLSPAALPACAGYSIPRPEFAQRTHSTLSVMRNGEHWFHTEEQMKFLDEWIVENSKHNDSFSRATCVR